MSEHRRKTSQSQGGGRAAARRAAQQSSGRRGGGQPPGGPSSSYEGGQEAPYEGRAAARRAAQRGGRRRGGPPAGGGGGGPRKKRFIDYPRFDRYGWRRWVPSWKLVSGLCLGFVAAVFAGGAVAYAVVQVPQASLISQAQSNVYYWDDGSPMVTTGNEANRQILPIDKIPKSMQDAAVSAENKTFYTDSGVDPEGMARAVYNMAKGGETQGGSTITQQYVKNARLGDQSQTFSRKFKELFISLKVGTEMSKQEILAGYLNTSYFGRGASGIQAAARAYYGKDADQLNASQDAFMASLLESPTYMDPAGNTDIDPSATPANNTAKAKARWNYVLNQMVENGYLTQAQRAQYTTFPMPDPKKENGQLKGQIGYLVNLASSNFVNNNKQGITAEDLDKGGFQIYTTFDKKKVDQMEAAVNKVKKANIDPKKRPKTDTYVQFGGASVEPSTGKIVAIYGGEDATKHFTDNADQTGAQVGSTFKPFVLAAAMEHGVRDPKGLATQPDSERTKLNPDKAHFSAKNKLKIKDYNGQDWTDKDGKEWLQANDEDESFPNVTLRTAMMKSLNSPFVQLGMDVGIPTVRAEAEKAGLLPDSLSKSDVPSFSIGISDPSAIRMAGAYSTFAESGQQRDPYSVTKVLRQGTEVYKHTDDPTDAMPEDVANNVTNVLQSVVTGGTGTHAQVPGHTIAGKTGTTDGNKSAWFDGYTPQLSTSIVMYRLDDNAAHKNRKFLEMYGTGNQVTIQGASFPSEIFKDYMTQALDGLPNASFPKAEPIGDPFYSGVASPTPTPTNSVSSTPSETPSDTPSVSDTPTAPPSPTDTCTTIFGCGNGGNGGGNGGNGGGNGGTNGGADGGTDGGTTGGTTGGLNGGTGTGGQSEPPGGNGGETGDTGGANGGLFGGGNG